MGQVNNADPADTANLVDLPVLVRDMWVRVIHFGVRVIHFGLAKVNNAELLISRGPRYSPGR